MLLLSNFCINVHIPSISDIPLAVSHCPSIGFYQQYHYICSVTIIGSFYVIRLQQLTDVNTESSMPSKIKNDCPNPEPLVSSCPLSSLTQSGCGQLPIGTKNQCQNANNIFIQEMTACISMIDSVLDVILSPNYLGLLSLALFLMAKLILCIN